MYGKGGVHEVCWDHNLDALAGLGNMRAATLIGVCCMVPVLETCLCFQVLRGVASHVGLLHELL